MLRFSTGSERLATANGHDDALLRVHLVLGDGERIDSAADGGPARVLLIAGRPLRDPVAKYGPFVMNTQQEIQQAIADLRAGRF